MVNTIKRRVLNLQEQNNKYEKDFDDGRSGPWPQPEYACRRLSEYGRVEADHARDGTPTDL